MRRERVLVARLDNAGDVLLCGPAIRAVAAHAAWTGVLASPRGAGAAGLLPGVDQVLTWDCPWISAVPEPVTRASVRRLERRVAALRVDHAVILTSFHQNALPLALLLRLAGVATISASSEDYPGALLDRRSVPGAHPQARHEVERMLAITDDAGFPLPAGDDRRLAIRMEAARTPPLFPSGEYVVFHAGSTAPARAPSAAWSARAVRALSAAGWPVALTGGPGEAGLTRAIAAACPAGAPVADLAGRTPELSGLAEVLAGAAAVVTGNTGPAHLAAAVGTPVVSLFAPVVPAERWRPWGVPYELLGDAAAACAGTRARSCPVPGHPCLDSISPQDVLAAVGRLAGAPPARPAARQLRRRVTPPARTGAPVRSVPAHVAVLPTAAVPAALPASAAAAAAPVAAAPAAVPVVPAPAALRASRVTVPNLPQEVAR